MLQLRKISLEQLKPASYNPRVALMPGTEAYERLERSMLEFQLVQPIVWNEQTGHVVSGHLRLNILKNWDETEVEVVVVSLSLEREKALNITLNNSQVGSDWDHDKLTTLVTELIDLPEFDATLTGFNAEELRDFQFTPDPYFFPEEPSLQTEKTVYVALEIPAAHWDEVHSVLDQLVGKWKFPIHIQFPSDG